MKLMLSVRVVRYIFFEMLPSFFLGMFVFVSIILMFQVLRLTEFALVHGVDIKTICEIVGYICISMMPALFPMSLLFAIILTYGRLSNDSEIIAMKSSGISMINICLPALILAVLVSLISGQTSFNIAPWGNRQFEVLFTKLSNMKAGATIREGTFSEGFFDLVLYAHEVDSDKGILKKVFIYDESQGDVPLTIIAKEGHIIPDPLAPGHKVLLRLLQGDVHRKSENHTKIKFNSYDIVLVDPIKTENREKSPQSLTLDEIAIALEKDKASGMFRPTANPLPPPPVLEAHLSLATEYHKRWAITVLCFVFTLIGVGLGATTNKRSGKSSGMITCIALIITYWILYIVCEGLARNNQFPVALVMWIPNVLFGLVGMMALKKNWN